VPLLYLTGVGEVSPEVLSLTEQRLAAVLGFEVRKLAPLAEPSYAWDPRRGQYSSIEILRELATRCPPDADRFMALTERDLFIPVLSFVYGQAQLGGKIALVSLARLRQEFYGMPPHAEVLWARLAKETLHEIGHTVGLVHCPDKGCAMSLATGLRQLDLKADALCGSCTIFLRETLDRIFGRSADPSLAENHR
jgi:archaemetzincin